MGKSILTLQTLKPRTSGVRPAVISSTSSGSGCCSVPSGK